MVLSFDICVRKYAPSHFRNISLILFSGLAAILIFNKSFNFYQTHQPINKMHLAAKELLSKKEFPPNSQIALVNYTLSPTAGYAIYSSGYINYVTQRRDLSGIVGVERYNYDPIGKLRRGFGKEYVMTGISLEEPAFFFKANEQNYSFEQYSQILQTLKDGSMKLLEFDLKDGSLKMSHEFSNRNSLEEFVKNNHLENRVLFMGAYK